MNKEIGEIIDAFKEYADGFTSVLAPPEESVKVLLDYINQLETSIATKDSELLQLKEELRQLKTNRDEAIELVKEIKLHYQQHPTMIPSVKIDKLLSLLERGKEC